MMVAMIISIENIPGQACICIYIFLLSEFGGKIGGSSDL